VGPVTHLEGGGGEGNRPTETSLIDPERWGGGGGRGGGWGEGGQAMAVLGLAALSVHSNSEICATQPAGALTIQLPVTSRDGVAIRDHIKLSCYFGRGIVVLF
jgi:hypothetical protein